MVRVHADSCDFSTHLYSAVEDEWDEKPGELFLCGYGAAYSASAGRGPEGGGEEAEDHAHGLVAASLHENERGEKTRGSLKREFRERWADYLCRYIREFRDRGYEVVRMSVQNEPKAVQTWDSCVYTAREEKEFYGITSIQR